MTEPHYLQIPCTMSTGYAKQAETGLLSIVYEVTASYLEYVLQTLKSYGHNPCVCACQQVTEGPYAPSLDEVFDLLASAT